MNQTVTSGAKRQYAFFCHKDCEYFPCHSGVAEEDFNCLFCYCPLYALGEACGGHYSYTATGKKTCADCSFPHRRESYDAIVARYPELVELAAKSK